MKAMTNQDRLRFLCTMYIQAERDRNNRPIILTPEIYELNERVNLLIKAIQHNSLYFGKEEL
jgi:hypothetical protein